MSIEDDGGHAFPRPVAVSNSTSWGPNNERAIRCEGGMKLRDYFAAEALSGLCANPSGPFQANDRTGWGFVNCDTDSVGDLAYRLADAMLKARQS